jgi:hypothetical protein
LKKFSAYLVAVWIAAGTSIYSLGTRDYANLPLNPYNAGLAGQSAHGIPTQAAATVNPAFLGYGDQNAFFAGGYYGSALTGFSLDGALFSPFGGLTMTADYLKADDEAVGLRFGYGSFLSRRIATGFTLSPRYVKSSGGNAFAFGLDPSLLFDSKWRMAFSGNDGVGLYSPTLFLQTRNLAIPIGDTDLLAKPGVHLGLMSGLYQSSTLNIATVISTYGTDQYDRVPILVGIQTQYHWALVSVGYGLNNFSATGDGLSLGLGVHLPTSVGDVFAMYSLSLGNASRSDLHSLSLGMRLGGIDTQPPEISFVPERLAFSPNNDGVQDVLNFSAEVSDKSPIVFYELRITNLQGQVVFTQKSDERIREKDFSWSLFFRSFVAPRGRAEIPATISWNGRVSSDTKAVKDVIFQDEATDSALPDGTYTYDFRALDEKNNESRHVTGNVYLDTKKPSAAVDIFDDLISPNGDGNRDILLITQDVNPGDTYDGYVVNAENEVVRTYHWQSNAPTRVEFNGKKDSGSLADEGVYRYKLVGRDVAGNSADAISQNFYISRRVDAAFLKASALGLNPKQKAHAEILLYPSLEFPNGYVGGEITIGSSCGGGTVHRIAIAQPMANLGKQVAGYTRPSAFIWRGESASGNRAPDGIYCAVYRAQFANGNTPESPPIHIALDTSPPELEADADLSVRQFTPDGDGEHEEQTFRLFVRDRSAVMAYSFVVQEMVPDRTGKLVPQTVRTFQGQGEVPRAIYWDGRTDNATTVESLTRYLYTLSVSDIYGNIGVSSPRQFETGVLAVATSAGFLIRLPNANLEDPVTERFDAVYSLLDKYTKYKVKVEVHSGNIGGIEKNLRLTETAARKIYEYLIDKGIATDRISYQGFGDAAPAYAIRGTQAAKNRRIDILLSR